MSKKVIPFTPQGQEDKDQKAASKAATKAQKAKLEYQITPDASGLKKALDKLNMSVQFNTDTGKGEFREGGTG